MPHPATNGVSSVGDLPERRRRQRLLVVVRVGAQELRELLVAERVRPEPAAHRLVALRPVDLGCVKR